MNKQPIKNISIRDLQAKLSIVRIYSIIMTIGFCIMGALLIIDHNKNINTIAQLEESIDVLQSNYNASLDKIESMSITISELTTISETLDTQNKSLVKSNDKYYNEVNTLKSKIELYENYDYALIDELGNRTDITYDQLLTLEELLKDSKVNDQDLILSWIMVESHGDETAKNPCSTAKGYGQFLDTTSKYVYEDIMNKSGWYPEIAYDGNTNLELMVNYIDYLYELNNHDLYETIRYYRGKRDISGYVAKIDSYLATKNKSVHKISQQLE